MTEVLMLKADEEIGGACVRLHPPRTFGGGDRRNKQENKGHV